MKNLNLNTPINKTGYGAVGFNLTLALQKHFSVALFPIGQKDLLKSGNMEDFNIMEGRQALFDYNAPSLKVWHQFALHSFPSSGLKMGFPIFELNKFTDLEHRCMNYCDVLLVCSEWAKQVLIDQRIESPDIEVVPLGVDRSVFYEEEIDSHPEFRFFSCGKWEIRKGQDQIVEAFNKAFKDEDVWLALNYDYLINDQMRKALYTKYKSTPMGHRISILPRQSSQEDIARIIRWADCGVFPSRAEGWNLELLEMMSCGRQVIATNYSGHTEFVNNKNALLIEPTSLIPAQDGRWFHGQGEWCDFNIDDLVDQMKYAYNNPTYNREGIKTAQKFSWENSALKIKEVYERYS